MNAHPPCVGRAIDSNGGQGQNRTGRRSGADTGIFSPLVTIYLSWFHQVSDKHWLSSHYSAKLCRTNQRAGSRHERLVDHKQTLNTVVRHSNNDLHWTATSTADTHYQRLGGPIENTLQPLRLTHSFALARCLIWLFSSIGLIISSSLSFTQRVGIRCSRYRLLDGGPSRASTP